MPAGHSCQSPRASGLLDIVRDVFAVAPLQAHQVALPFFPQVLHDFFNVTMPRSPTKTTRSSPNRCRRSCDHFRHRGLVQPIAGEHMMGNRPALHHHHPHHDLPVARLAIPAVTESAPTPPVLVPRSRSR